MTAEDVIRTHTEGFNRALTTHDLEALSAIYADDYMLVRPDGSVLGKEDVLPDLGVTVSSSTQVVRSREWASPYTAGLRIAPIRMWRPAQLRRVPSRWVVKRCPDIPGSDPQR